MGTAVERLAALAAGVRAEELPDDVVKQAADRLLDGLGCMLAGAQAPVVGRVYDAVADRVGSATLIGDGRMAGPAEAALANTTALRYLDFMDGHPGPYPCHPSLTIPAAIAAAEVAGATGLELLRAIVLMYELDIRLQIGSGDPDITAHGWSGSTNVGVAIPFGIGGLLGLTESQVAHAIAISTVHAPTLDASGRGQMAESKSAVDGMVALTAVTATLLASKGLGGKLAAWEGEDGFVRTLSKHCDEDVVFGPITHFRVMDVYTKYFNAVKCAQTAVAAALELRPAIGDLQSIASITMRLTERDYRNQLQDESARRRPANRDTANHSAVYCVAAALVAGDLQSAQFERRCLEDPLILGLIDKIDTAPDAEFSSYWPGANPAGVTITMTSGAVYRADHLYSPGHPENPMSDQQLANKFRTQAGKSIAADRVDGIITGVRDVREMESLDPLMAMVSGRA